MAKPKIFVSHSTKDNAFASTLVNDLNAAGAQAWMDVNDLGAGNFPENISEALADCEWFVLVLTRNALASDWVHMEVDAAIRLRHQKQVKDLIFIKASDIDHTELPALWGVFNILDATVDYATALEKTLKAVEDPSATTNLPTTSSSSHLSPLPQSVYQLAATQVWPNLVLVRTKLGRLEGNKRLARNTGYSITLQNESEHRASEICAVLFPSSTYLKRGILGRKRYDLGGIYWTVPASGGAGASMRRKLHLQEARRPLHGNDHLTPQHTLYASEEPWGGDQFYSARLTVTYRTDDGTRLASIFDLDADRLSLGYSHAWLQITGPIEVELDLLDLMRWATLLRKSSYIG